MRIKFSSSGGTRDRERFEGAGAREAVSLLFAWDRASFGALPKRVTGFVRRLREIARTELGENFSKQPAMAPQRRAGGGGAKAEQHDALQDSRNLPGAPPLPIARAHLG